MSLAREWTAFAGAAFALMGGVIGGGAAAKVDDLFDWERERRVLLGSPEPADDPARRARLESAYRAGGIAFAAFGALLLACAALGIAPPLERARRDALPAGVVLTGCAVVVAAASLIRKRRSRGPRFLAGEPLAAEAPPPRGEALARFCSRALVILLAAFGIRLLRESLR